MAQLLEHFFTERTPSYGSGEMSSEKYFYRLSDEDRGNVNDWLNIIRRLNDTQKNGFYVVTAIGSSARKKLYGELVPNDIDLLVQHSSKPSSIQRKAAMFDVQQTLLATLQDPFQRESMELQSFAMELPESDGYFTQDISFRLFHTAGLPVHITTPTIDTPRAQDKIREERRSGDVFSILYDPSGRLISR